MLAPSEGLKAHGWTGNLNLSWVYRTPHDYTFAAYGGLSTKRIELQGRNSGWHYYGLSADKDMLKNKSLNVTLSAMNMFEDRVSFITTTNTPNLHFRQ